MLLPQISISPANTTHICPCWRNAGPTLWTMGRNFASIGLMYYVRWESTNEENKKAILCVQFELAKLVCFTRQIRPLLHKLDIGKHPKVNQLRLTG